MKKESCVIIINNTISSLNFANKCTTTKLVVFT